MMFSLNYLPELIVYPILGYNIKHYGSFKEHLPYLAICHSWRNVALPLVYKVVFFSPYYRHNSQAIWNSNVGLFLSTRYFQLVKKLYIYHHSLKESRSVEELGMLLNLMNMEPLEWPADGQQKLVPLGVPLREGNNPQLLLDSDMLMLLNGTISRFIRKFPKICDMELELCNPDGVFRQLNAQLVNVLSGSLFQLCASMLYGEDLTQISQNLTSLTYKCNERSFPVLSKVNSLPLTKLYLSNLPFDFSWSLFQKDPGSNDPVVFWNLKDLMLKFGESRRFREGLARTRGLNATTPSRHTNIQFPRLRHLFYRNFLRDFVLQPGVIPSHLDSVHLEVGSEEFQECRNLPIASIGSFDVRFVDKYDDPFEFGTAADRLFNKIEITDVCTVDLSSIRYLDIKLVRWKNVTNLTLYIIDNYELVHITCSMPQMETLTIQGLECKKIRDDLIPHLLMNESRLEELEVMVYFCMYYSNDIAISHFVNVLLSLKCLQEVILEVDKVEEVRKKIELLANLYPRLNNLEIMPTH